MSRTSGVPHNCAASTEQLETNTIHSPPFRLIAVLCSAIRRTTQVHVMYTTQSRGVHTNAYRAAASN
jgi:hypothetical protein